MVFNYMDGIDNYIHAQLKPCSIQRMTRMNDYIHT